MSVWTEERVAQLKALFADGYSASPPAPILEPSGAHQCDLLALTIVSCRWPVTADPPHMFCGEPTADLANGRPCCPYHAERATNRSRDYAEAA